jgi:uncharacterized RDD family membrane protein YckC
LTTRSQAIVALDTPLDTVYAVETPEGIALSLRAAGPVARLLAAVIDLCARIGLWIVTLIIGGILGAMGTAFVLVSLFLIEWAYPIVFELGMSGATPGKRAMGLQVVMDSGLPVTPAASITRNLLRAADFLPALYAFGALSLLMRPDFKRLGDLAAGTLVVHIAPVSLHGELQPAPPLAPARPLSLREQAAVISWAGRKDTLTGERMGELAALARPIFPVGAAKGPEIAAEETDTIALMGIAQWLMGRREGETP